MIQALYHLSAYRHNVVDTIYLLDHYAAGVILFGVRAALHRQSLPKVLSICDAVFERNASSVYV